MSKKHRIQRPKDELKRELIEQLKLLRMSCEVFDRGVEAIGKHIALSIRVLVHEHGQSRALLAQLGFRSVRFLDSAGELSATNLLPECKLTALRVSSTEGRYIAPLDRPIPMRPVPFVEWWNTHVVKDQEGRKFCRRDLVLNVADTDGGAHVDPELDEAYMALSRANSLGWEFHQGNIISALAGRPELVCMRQIGHELLCTVYHGVPEFRTHSEPVIPQPQTM